jgi:hypothetical protein
VSKARLVYAPAVLFLMTLVGSCGASSIFADFTPGTGAQLRSSTNYVIADTLGQFVVGVSRQCAEDVDPIYCPYSCAILEHGFWHSDIHIPAFREIKQAGNNTWVDSYAKVVTAGTDQLDRAFYVEDSDRLGALRVSTVNAPDVQVAAGDMVDVYGMIKTSQRERYVDFPVVTLRFSGAGGIYPFFAANRGLGGKGTDTLTIGGVGVNNVSLLVRTSGRVNYVDTSAPAKFFYVDDGSSLSDGVVISGHSMKGIRVSLANLAVGNTIYPPTVGQYVMVKGICAPQAVGVSRVYAQIRPRSQGDIVVVAGP